MSNEKSSIAKRSSYNIKRPSRDKARSLLMRGFFQSVDPSIEVIVEPRPRSDKLEGSLEILERIRV